MELNSSHRRVIAPPVWIYWTEQFISPSQILKLTIMSKNTIFSLSNFLFNWKEKKIRKSRDAFSGRLLQVMMINDILCANHQEIWQNFYLFLKNWIILFTVCIVQKCVIFAAENWKSLNLILCSKMFILLHSWDLFSALDFYFMSFFNVFGVIVTMLVALSCTCDTIKWYLCF